ncbi:MAG TPA: M55 family metallopeptidase, partial [Candidatus Tumulicola sp.]|nr:M55 family metallopeptidase [Candidatus Tumulicola sp.]
TFDGPCQLEIDTAGVEQADFIELMPGFERIGGRRVRFRAAAYPQAYRAFVAATRLGTAASA